MTTTYRCNQCGKDCGTKAKVTANQYLHFCSYLCAQLYYEKSYILYEESDRETKERYWDAQREARVAGR